MDDSFCIRKVKKGKTEYFSFIVEKYQTHLFNIAKKITGDYSAAEDITQEAFLKFFNAIRSFDETRPVFPYLVRIVSNCAKDYIKRESRQNEIKENVASNMRSRETAETFEEIYELIYALPERERNAILLHYRDGKSVKEIARVMNISVSNAKVILFRGRRALFELWKKEK